MPQPPAKRPGVLGWIGLGLLVVVALIVVKVMFVAAIPHSTLTQSVAGTVAPGYYGNGKATDDMRDSGAPPMEAPMPPSASEAGGSAAIPSPTTPGQAPDLQRIIKTGELMLRVADAPKGVNDIQAIVAGKHGYVESSSISDSGNGPRSAWLTVRVPADSFDATIQELKAASVVVLNESTHGQDVTSEFVDLDADLRNAQAEEASYLEIMKRAGDIDDVLNVAKSLADVRGRIERLEGRKRYLSSQTDLATITVTLTEDTHVEVPGHTWKPLEVLRQSFQQLVESLQNLVDFLIRATVAVIGLLVPIALIAAFVMWVGWKIVKALLRRLRK